MRPFPLAATAFATALLTTLLATPLVRRLALSSGIVDRPGQHKSHTKATPYLGGVAIIAGTFAGALFVSGRSSTIAVIAFGGAAVGTVGLLDDDRALPPLPRLLAQVAAALALVAAGVEARVTGVTVLDLAITLVWIVGITNAVNLLDNMDGLAAGVTAAAAGSCFVLAGLGGGVVVAVLSVSLVGACIGFLAFNMRPSSIFMGDTGSLFLGLMIAVVALEVEPALRPPASFVVPLLLVALPVLDTTTVTLARLRRGISVSTGGRDHLSHRLVRRGLSPGIAVAVLVAAELVVGLLAVLAGRGILSTLVALSGAAVVLGVLALSALPAPVYDVPVVGLPKRVRLAIAGVPIVAALVAAPAVIALVKAQGHLRAGVDAASRALEARERGEIDEAIVEFDRASKSFAAAKPSLGGALVAPGRLVPALSSNLTAARSLADVGRDLSSVGKQLTEATSGDQLVVENGQVPLDRVRTLAGPLAETAQSLQYANEAIRQPDGPYVVPPLRSALRELRANLPALHAEADRAAQAARLAPAMFGEGSPRRYLVVVRDAAAPRASGGAVTHWGIVGADKGKLRVERFLPMDGLAVAQRWAEATSSPDFGRDGRAMARLYTESMGQRVDGVLAVDAVALAGLLRLTGPVDIPGVAPRATARDVAELARSTRPDRRPLLGTAAETIFTQLTVRRLGDPTTLVQTLGESVRDRNLQIYLDDPAEQALVARIGAAGSIAPVRSDALAVTTVQRPDKVTNTALARSVRYSVALDPRGSVADIAGIVDVEVEQRQQGATAVAGAATGLSLYTPLDVRAATMDGDDVEMRSARDLDRRVHTTDAELQSATRLVAEVAGRVLLTDNWYVLDLSGQPALAADDVTVEVAVPDGWRITEAEGVEVTGSRRASGTIEVSGMSTVRVRVAREGLYGLWDRLRRRA